MKLKISIITACVLISFSGCSNKNQNLSVFNKINKINLNKNFITMNKSSSNKTSKQNIKNTTTKNQNIPFIKPNIHFNNKKLPIIKMNNKKEIAINVENIPIADFIKLVFGQILNYNYTLDNNIEKMKTKITLNMKKKVSETEFFNIVKNILNSYKIIIENKNNIFYIKKGTPKKIEKLSNYFIYGRKLPKNINPNAIITMIIPSYYIDLTSIEWMIKKYYLSNNALVINKRDFHVMFITDKAENIKKALQFINLIDNPTLKNKTVELIHLKYIDAITFKKRLQTILPSLGIKIAHKLNDLGILLQPIEELNSILIISDKKSWINVVSFWKNKLDTLDINSNKGKIFIYKPKNRDGETLVKLIKNIFPNKDKNNPLKVIFDKERNNIIFFTTPYKYENILTMLNKLDTLPRQVLIQVTIAEITLKNSLQYGLEWFLQHQGKTSYSIGTLGNLGIGSGGIVGNIVTNSKNFQSLLNALAQKNLINILSSPKLIVLNGKTASINVGTQVPVLTSSTTTNNNATTQVTQSVQYRNTGVILNVTPLIHSNGTLTLKISQTVSDPQPNNTSSISSPIILNRSLNTEVVLKSNQALLLGGLIKENKGYTINKVPILGDIPGLKYLFSTKSTSTEKTELIMIVKPIIINNKNEADDITKSFKKLLLKNE